VHTPAELDVAKFPADGKNRTAAISAQGLPGCAVVRIGRQERRRRRARTPAGIVRTKLHTLKPMAGDNGQDEIVEVLTRARKTLIWERT
jgi:hypothetical protein